MNRSDLLWTIAFVAGCFVVAAIGGLSTASSVDGWYRTLERPSWNPPNWIFGPVWTLLYLMMGIAAGLVWQHRREANVRPAMALFGVQLALNLAWSLIFFGMRQPGLAAVEIVVLWLAIVATIVAFKRHSKAATGLLVPYLAWVSFAAVLNMTIWRLN